MRGTFTNNQRLGIALSGGPDSLALLLLAGAAYPGQIEAATVDHKLRVESADEAQYCAAISAKLGVPHAILAVQEPITGNLQSAARAARYTLLETWAKERGIAYILTAHHADDQAETFLMRLKRGTGVAGLASVRARNESVRTRNEIGSGDAGQSIIVRPLLGWRKHELDQIVAEAGFDPVRDPSNHNDAFDRARLRKALVSLSATQAEWFDPIAISKTAQHLKDANDALDWAAERARTALTTRHDDGIDIAADFAEVPYEIQRRILLATFAALDAGLSVRGDALDTALAAMIAQRKTMLGDWIITPRKAPHMGWVVEKAPPRNQS